MAANIDDLPIFDALTKMKDGKPSSHLSDTWTNSIANLTQNLQEYLSENGILTPNITSTQQGQIQTPQNGQTIYNQTSNIMQVYSNGGWVNTFSQFGMFLPQITTTQRNSVTAINGQMIYNTTTNKIQGFSNGAWVDIA